MRYKIDIPDQEKNNEIKLLYIEELKEKLKRLNRESTEKEEGASVAEAIETLICCIEFLLNQCQQQES